MLTAQSLLAWTVMSIGLVLLPGPDTMLVAGHAARRGMKAGMAAIGGIQLGGLFYMLLCGFGFLSVLNAVPGLFMAVKIAGALYLAWMGLGLLRGAMKPAPAEQAAKLRLGGSPFMQGFISTVLNPKVAIFFLAALPGRTVAGHGADRDRLCARLPVVRGAGGARHEGRPQGRAEQCDALVRRRHGRRFLWSRGPSGPCSEHIIYA
jgi:threonine/homoserine/homoserine lactone efflux protein